MGRDAAERQDGRDQPHRRRRRWHQTWVDGQGNLLQLDGAFNGGKMTLTGETVDSSGATWTTAFDGRYRKRR